MKGIFIARVLIIGATASALTACGAVAIGRARSDMDASKAAYKACLEQNPKAVGNCEALRLAYQADVQNFDAITGRTPSSVNNSVSITGAPR